MSKTKVLHVIKTLGLGGAEANLLNLVKAVDSKRFEIHVAYSGAGEFAERFHEAGICLFQFDKAPQKIKSLATLRIIWKLYRYIKKNNIQIVHTHTFNAHLWASVAAKWAGCKILEHVHDSRYMDPAEFERRGETSRQYRWIRRLKNISDLTVVLTKHHYDFVLRHQINSPDRLREIQNGIAIENHRAPALSKKESIRKKLNLSPDAKVVLTPIRFSPEKNLDVLFGIVCDVTARVPEAVCLIAGSGPEKDKFDAKIRVHHAEQRIRTLGFYADIPELLSVSDVFLLPSTIELHSIALLEAMRQRVPVVVSRNVGCHDEFITDWENGVLLDPFKVEGWGAAIQRILLDDNLRLNMGEAGFWTVAAKFDIRNIAMQIEGCYVDLAKA